MGGYNTFKKNNLHTVDLYFDLNYYSSFYCKRNYSANLEVWIVVVSNSIQICVHCALHFESVISNS